MKEKINGKMEGFAERIAKWVGTPVSIAAHTIAFLIILSLGLFGMKWDSVLLLLTTLLSIEAIYLGLFNQLITNKVVDDTK